MDKPKVNHMSWWERLWAFDEGVTRAVPLPPWDMYTVFVGLMSGYLLFPILVYNILQIVDPFMDPPHALFIQQVVTLATWAVIFKCIGWRYRIPMPHYLGLRMQKPFSYYVLSGVWVLISMAAMMLVLNGLSSLLGAPPEKPYEDFSSDELKIISLFAVLTAPILEEIIFRGFVQSTFYKFMTPVRAVFFTCVVFVLFHGVYLDQLQALIYVLMLGLILGYWRERTQSVIPGMIGHLFNNALASVMMLK